MPTMGKRASKAEFVPNCLRYPYDENNEGSNLDGIILDATKELVLVLASHLLVLAEGV
jgi:hypothetical protein